MKRKVILDDIDPVLREYFRITKDTTDVNTKTLPTITIPLPISDSKNNKVINIIDDDDDTIELSLKEYVAGISKLGIVNGDNSNNKDEYPLCPSDKCWCSLCLIVEDNKILEGNDRKDKYCKTLSRTKNI